MYVVIKCISVYKQSYIFLVEQTRNYREYVTEFSQYTNGISGHLPNRVIFAACFQLAPDN